MTDKTEKMKSLMESIQKRLNETASCASVSAGAVATGGKPKGKKKKVKEGSVPLSMAGGAKPKAKAAVASKKNPTNKSANIARSAPDTGKKPHAGKSKPVMGKPILKKEGKIQEKQKPGVDAAPKKPAPQGSEKKVAEHITGADNTFEVEHEGKKFYGFIEPDGDKFDIVISASPLKTVQGVTSKDARERVLKAASELASVKEDMLLSPDGEELDEDDDGINPDPESTARKRHGEDHMVAEYGCFAIYVTPENGKYTLGIQDDRDGGEGIGHVIADSTDEVASYAKKWLSVLKAKITPEQAANADPKVIAVAKQLLTPFFA